ncbi:MAG: diguanylate cyclase [Actinomycetota bacterium]
MGDANGRRAVQWRIIAIAGGMVAAAIPLHAFALSLDGPVSPFHLPWWGLALGFAASEGFVIHLHVRRDAHTVSLSEIPFMLGMATAGAGSLIGGRLAGSGVALVFERHQPLYKLVFNLSLFYLETTASLAVYRASLAGRSPVSIAGLGAGLLALTVSVVIGAAMVSVAIAVNQPGRPMRAVIRSLVAGLVISLVSAGLAVGSLAVAWREPLALVGVVVIAAAVYGALRIYGSLNQRFEDLEAVYAFASAVDQSVDTDDLVEATLTHSRELFDADLVEVVMSRGVGSTVTSLGNGDGISRRPAPPAVAEAVAVAAGAGSLVSSLRDAPAAVAAHYRDRHVEDGMVALLGGGSGTASMIVVAGRRAGGPFTADERRILEVLARQAGVSFERGRLVDRLRREVGHKEHQALHDALTDLPNRLQFSLVVGEALRKAADSGGRVAVLLIDLDRFREINDTLGHQRGDVLLQELAARLSDFVGGADLARLGGDEFGVLLREVSGVAEAIDWARRINDVLHRPFLNEGLAIQVSGSIGIAIAPEHGTDDTTLLRRADVAMYEAKRAGSTFEVYDPQRDRYSTRRLAMAADLRDAIEGGTLGVHYQPKARLADGQVVGVEALSRWHHPRHGAVAPRRVHRAGGTHRFDRPADRARPQNRIPRSQPASRRRAPAFHGREHRCVVAQRRGVPRPRGTADRRVRRRSSGRDARGHRGHHDERLRPGPVGTGSTRRARGVPLHRRLRHWVLVALVSEQPARGRGEDRSLIRDGHGGGRASGQDRRLHHGARAQSRDAGGRRGSGEPRHLAPAARRRL